MNVYSIYDKVAKEGGPLFHAQNDDVARRMLRSMVKNSPELAQDYVLYQVGEYEVGTLRLRGYLDDMRVVEVEK